MTVGFPGSSVGEESACNAGDPDLTSGSGRSSQEWNGYPFQLGFPYRSVSKESACNVESLGSIPGLGGFPGERNGNLLQYSCLENPHGQRSLAGYTLWGRKSQTRLSG